MKIRVCHMSSVHRNDDIRIFVKECKTLAQAGYDVTFVAQGQSREDDGVHVIGIGGKPRGRRARMGGFAKQVYQTAKALNCQVYHLHDPELLPYGLKLKRQGKHVIFDSHEDVAAQILDKPWIPKPLRKLVSILYMTYETYAVKRIDAVVAATPHIGRRFENRAGKVIVVNNYPKLDDIAFHDLPFERRDEAVCYAGGINELRGESVMVAAMTDTEGKLVLAGDRDRSFAKKNQ